MIMCSIHGWVYISHVKWQLQNWRTDYTRRPNHVRLSSKITGNDDDDDANTPRRNETNKKKQHNQIFNNNNEKVKPRCIKAMSVRAHGFKVAPKAFTH